MDHKVNGNRTCVSIVTPSLNQVMFLKENLASVAMQATPQIEIEHVVVDGGSTDGTIELLKATPGITWVSEKDHGQSDAINKGLRMATGSFIGWMNSDDSYLPHAAETAVTFLTSNPDVSMVYGDCYIVNANGQRLYSYDTREFDLDQLLNYGDFIPQQAVFLRREVLDEVGPLDQNLHLAMDYDFWIRIAKRFRVAYIPVHMANFRRHEQTKTTQSASAHWREALMVSRRHGGRLFSRLLFRHCCHSFYRVLPKQVRSIARTPAFERAARLVR